MAKTSYYSMNGMMFGESTNGVMRNYVTDALRSVVGTLSNGTAENTYQYKPYGGLLAKTGTAADPSFPWNGGSGYRNTGLGITTHYVRSRHYSQVQCLWTTLDIFWPDLRPYVYADGSPAFLIDPSGRECTATVVTSISNNGTGSTQSSNTCPQAVQDGITGAWTAFCKKYSSGLSDQQLSDLANCAKSKMPSNCSSWQAPGLSSLSNCIKGWCQINPATLITCNSSDPACKGTCMDTYCYGKPPLKMLTTNICPQAYDKNCNVTSGCATGSGVYNIKSWTPPKGMSKWMQMLIHEMLHDCATCGADSTNKCDESYTQALTVCMLSKGM